MDPEAQPDSVEDETGENVSYVNELTGGNYGNEAQPAEPEEETDSTDDGEPVTHVAKAAPVEADELTTLRAQLAEYQKFDPAISKLKQDGYEDGTQFLEKFEGHVAQTAYEQQFDALVNERIAERGAELQGMLDEGLITEAAYERLYEQAEQAIGAQVEVELSGQSQAQYTAQQAFNNDLQSVNQQYPEFAETRTGEGQESYTMLDVIGQYKSMGAQAGVDIPAANIAAMLAPLLKAHAQNEVLKHVTQDAKTAQAAPVSGANGGAPPATNGEKLEQDDSYYNLLLRNRS